MLTFRCVPLVDPTSYPYGRCDCADAFTVSACHSDNDCMQFACSSLDEVCLCDSPWCDCMNRYEPRPPAEAFGGANRTSFSASRNGSYTRFIA